MLIFNCMSMQECVAKRKCKFLANYFKSDAYKKFNSPRNGSTMKKIDRERQYTTERTSKH